MSTPWPSVCRHRGSVCLLFLIKHCRWFLCFRLLCVICLLIGWSVLFWPTSNLEYCTGAKSQPPSPKLSPPAPRSGESDLLIIILFDRWRHVANALLAFRATTISMVPGGGSRQMQQNKVLIISSQQNVFFLVKIRRIMIIDTFRDMILKLHVSQIDWLKTRLSSTLHPLGRDPFLIKSGRSLSGQAGLLTTFFCLAPSTTEKQDYCGKLSSQSTNKQAQCQKTSIFVFEVSTCFSRSSTACPRILLWISNPKHLTQQIRKCNCFSLSSTEKVKVVECFTCFSSALSESPPSRPFVAEVLSSSPPCTHVISKINYFLRTQCFALLSIS